MKESFGLLVMVLAGKIFLSFPRDMALMGQTAGWIIVIFSGLVSLIGFYFLGALLRKFPAQNIIEIGHEVGGSWVGTILGLVIFLFFLILTSLIMRKYAENFIISILPRTPISVISFIFLGIMIYAAVLGIETLTRVAWFFGPYLLATLAAILFFALTKGDLQRLSPILGPGPFPLLKDSLIHSSMYTEILLLGLIAPLIRKKDKISRIGFFSILITIALNVIVTLGIVMIFGYHTAGRLIFPIYQLARLITITEFVQRVESIFVFLWFFAAGVQLCGLFYGTVISYAQTFKIKNYRPLVFPLAVLVFTISLLPGSISYSILLNDFVLTNFYTAAAFGVPFLLWLLAIILKRSGQSG